MSPADQNNTDQEPDGTPLGDSDDRTFMDVIRHFLGNAPHRKEKPVSKDVPGE